MKKSFIIITTVISVSLLGATFFAFGDINLAPDETHELPVYHQVTFDTSGGTNISPITVKHGDKISKPDDPILFGHSIDKWKYNGIDWDFNKNVVNNDIVLKAEWCLSTYRITYDFDGGHQTTEMHDSYTIESSFTLAPAEKNNNIFLGWFDRNNNHIERIELNSTGHIYLKALWNDHLIFENTEPAKGTISIVGKNNDCNNVVISMTIKNNKHHIFKGWFDENNSLLSKNEVTEIELNRHKTNYVLAKYMNDEEEEIWNISHGVTPSKMMILGNQYVKYGMFPQSRVTDSELITILNELSTCSFNEYYYFNHEYYVPQKAKLYYGDKGVFFNNNDIIQEDTIYWFKVEPIIWDILSDNDTLFLTSHNLLENIAFNRNTQQRIINGKEIYPNNYEHSPLREYLNEKFRQKVFFWNDITVKVEVDNSQSTTNNCDMKYLSDTTFDYVYLLSYKDLNDPNLGFSNRNSRAAITSEYARCQHAYISLAETSYNCGCYYTRSPANVETGLSGYRVTIDGTLNYAWVGNNYSMIRPCITLYNNLLNA